jgi:Cu-Zn family superoxide dismutase
MRTTPIIALSAALALTGCAHLDHHAHHNIEADPARGVVPLTEDSPLVAVIQDVNDSGVAGTLFFTRMGEGIRVSGTVTGLDPNGKHGFHVHAYGDATNLDNGTSAGVHFNPFGHDHELAGSTDHHAMAHAGDFPNLEADANGTATVDFVAKAADLTFGPAAIIGRSIIIHEKEDVGDQPWGGAGGRIAIGIIGLANPDSLPAAE